MTSIEWPATGATTTGRYYRYDPITGEVDDLPERIVEARGSSSRVLVRSKAVFQNNRTVDALRTRAWFQVDTVRLYGRNSIQDAFPLNRDITDTHQYGNKTAYYVPYPACLLYTSPSPRDA